MQVNSELVDQKTIAAGAWLAAKSPLPTMGERLQPSTDERLWPL